MDYNLLHATTANDYIAVSDKNVLVVGCNTGKDCSYFIEFGAKTVVGIDVIDQIGFHYPHERVQYRQMSVENIDFEDNTFDLVYCFATMEHVANISNAYAEMLRVTKYGGLIYCVAAPLWNSRQGHHKDYIFDIDKYPWIHLRFSKDVIKEMCKAGEIDYPSDVGDINSEIDYMFNPLYFNFLPSTTYLQACHRLPDTEIIRNDLDFEDEKYLEDHVYTQLCQTYSRAELLALTHTFVAKKLDFRSLRTDLKQAHNEIASLKTQIDSLNHDLDMAENLIQSLNAQIAAMESTKFWKLREYWFRFKRFLKPQQSQ